MITLSNFVKQADDYVLLLTMGAHDTADMLPTAQRQRSLRSRTAHSGRKQGIYS